MTNYSLQPQTLGDHLRFFRKKARLTQADVAAKLGISPQAYSHYETGRRAPSPAVFCQIAQLYHVSMECLLTGKQNSSDSISRQITDLQPQEQEDVEQFIAFLFNRRDPSKDPH